MSPITMGEEWVDELAAQVIAALAESGAAALDFVVTDGPDEAAKPEIRLVASLSRDLRKLPEGTVVEIPAVRAAVVGQPAVFLTKLSVDRYRLQAGKLAGTPDHAITLIGITGDGVVIGPEDRLAALAREIIQPDEALAEVDRAIARLVALRP